MWYHCHVNVNEHVAMRGMWGPLIIDPKDPPPVEKEVTKDYIMTFSNWVSNWANKPGQGGIPGDEPDFFTLNGKAFPGTQPLRIKKGDVIRIRLIGAGDEMHSIHIHGHDFEVYAKDGRPYAEIPVKDQAFYTWKNKNFVPDFLLRRIAEEAARHAREPRLQRRSGTLTPCFQGDKYEKAAVGSWIGGGLCRRCVRGQRS